MIQQFTIFDQQAPLPAFEWETCDKDRQSIHEEYLTAHVGNVRLVLSLRSPTAWSGLGQWDADLIPDQVGLIVAGIRGPDRGWVESMLGEALQEWQTDPWPGSFLIVHPNPWKVPRVLDAIRRRPASGDRSRT